MADPYWPSRPWRVWLPELLLAGCIGLVLAPSVLFLPMAAVVDFVFLALRRAWPRLRRCRRLQYRRRPGSCRVAVIGAGWSGLAIAARLRELGVPFQGFEEKDDVGGTWHPSRRYADLELHTPAYGASFAEVASVHKQSEWQDNSPPRRWPQGRRGAAMGSAAHPALAH